MWSNKKSEKKTKGKTNIAFWSYFGTKNGSDLIRCLAICLPAAKYGVIIRDLVVVSLSLSLVWICPFLLPLASWPCAPPCSSAQWTDKWLTQPCIYLSAERGHLVLNIKFLQGHWQRSGISSSVRCGGKTTGHKPLSIESRQRTGREMCVRRLDRAQTNKFTEVIHITFYVTEDKQTKKNHDTSISHHQVVRIRVSNT